MMIPSRALETYRKQAKRVWRKHAYPDQGGGDPRSWKMPTLNTDQLPMSPTPLGPCERCGDGMVRDAEGVYCPSCGHRTNPDIQNGRIDMYAPLGEGIGEGPYDTMSKVADITPRSGVRFVWNDVEYEITGRSGDRVYFEELGTTDAPLYGLPLREWQYEVGMGNIYRTAGIGFQIGDRVRVMTDEKAHGNYPWSFGGMVGEITKDYGDGEYMVYLDLGNESSGNYIFGENEIFPEHMEEQFQSKKESKWAAVDDRFQLGDIVECVSDKGLMVGQVIEEPPVDKPQGYYRVHFDDGSTALFTWGFLKLVHRTRPEMPTEEIANDLWPDTLPWSETEQDYYRHASYWVMEGNNLPWWLPSKTAADVRALAEQARQKLWQRDDLKKLWEQMAQFEHICAKYGIADNEEGLYLLERIFPWIENRSKEPPLFRANMESRGYGDISAYINHAEELKPYWEAYQQGQAYETLINRIVENYPGGYKLLPWAVSQLKKDRDLWTNALKPGNRNWIKNEITHMADIAGQTGELLTELRQNNRLPQGFDINQLSFNEAEDWLNAYRAQHVGEGWEERNVWATLPNGWTVEEVKTKNDLQREGELMGHCVGGYCRQVEAGTSLIFSLRDPNGGPHVTLEYKPIYDQMTDEGGPYQHQIWNPQGAKITRLELVQVQGKSDSKPKPEYQQMVAEFNKYLQGEGYQVVWSANAWRHDRGPTDQQLQQLRHENQYDLRGIEGLHQLEYDYDSNYGVRHFLKQVPDQHDEYGVLSPSGVPENWLQHPQLKSATEDVLNEVFAGQITPDQYEEYGRKLTVAWYSLLSQPYASQGNTWGRYSPKSPVDARTWLVQFIGNFGGKLMGAFNENGKKDPNQYPAMIEGLTNLTAFQNVIGQRTGTQMLDWTSPKNSEDYNPHGNPLHFWQQKQLNEDQGATAGDYIPARQDLAPQWQMMDDEPGYHPEASWKFAMPMTIPQQQRAWEGTGANPKVVYEFPNGWTVRQAQSPEDVDAIGLLCRNCWQGYDNHFDTEPSSVYYRDPEYYSLFNSYGLPIVAFYVRDGHLEMALGPRNRNLAPEEAQMLEEFASANHFTQDTYNTYRPEDTYLDVLRQRDMTDTEPLRESTWKYAVAGIPANYTEEDPLDLQGKQPVFDNMQVDWWKLPPDQQKQAIVNAFRATMLSPRLNLKNNAIMYQEFMNIPANESDPDVFEQHARDLKERWDRQGQGDIFDEVQPMGWEQVVPGKLIPGFWGNIRRLAALGPYADQLRQAALDDLNENGGRGTTFRQEVLKLGIPGVGPKVASFAWLALNPKGSDLATIDVWMMRHLNQDEESPRTPAHYFDLEDQLRDEKDALYGPNVPLGQYQWGVWDKIRTPGYHQDHSPLKVYDPTPYTDVAWSPQYRAPRPQQLPEQAPGQEQLFARSIHKIAREDFAYQKEEWKPGERAYFEYHCFESDKSCDAEMWHHSHQPCTIVGLDPQGEYANGLQGTVAERAEWANPATYRVRFDDGFEYTAFEDELMTSPDGYYRPDPPARTSFARRNGKVEFYA